MPKVEPSPTLEALESLKSVVTTLEATGEALTATKIKRKLGLSDVVVALGVDGGRLSAAG